MIREINRGDGTRYVVYGYAKGKKVYVGSYYSRPEAEKAEEEAIAGRERELSRTKQADGVIIALKIYAVHANQAESLLVHDTIGSDHRTYEVDVNGQAVGVWLQQLTTASGSMSDEEWKRWYYDDESTSAEVPF